MKLKKGLISIIVAGLFLSNTYNVGANNNYNDKIHFLPVGSGDAILIESNGLFALVDGGEDSDYVKSLPETHGPGYEDIVIDYIKKVAGDENGQVKLEFIVGTHAHSDHLGGLDTVVNDPDIYVKKGYLKVYNEKKIVDSEVKNWDNKKVYTQLRDALKREKSKIVQTIPVKPFKFGDLTIQFYNTKNNSTGKVGENENSLGLLVSKNNQKVFLAGDINNLDGDEDRIANELGKIDLLKIGHHGYGGSSSLNFLNKLKPAYSIMTNLDTNINHQVSKNLDSIKTKVYPTMENNGIIATFDKADFGLSGYKQNRKWISENGKWYFKNNENEYVKDWIKLHWKDKSDWYYFDKNGVMQTGWVKIYEKWYYLNEQTDSKGYRGAMLTGWQQLKYNNKTNWYYFDKNGVMLTGWQQLEYNNKTDWYYFSNSGAMQTGWQQLKYNNKTDWYYFSNSGPMQTGWIQLGGKWYYLNEQSDSKGYRGAMLTGTHKLKWNGKWSNYTFNSSGQLV